MPIAKRKREDGTPARCQNVVASQAPKADAPERNGAVRADINLMQEAQALASSQKPVAKRKSTKRRGKSLSLSQRGRKAAVLDVLAIVEAQRLTRSPELGPTTMQAREESPGGVLRSVQRAPLHPNGSSRNLGKPWGKSDLQNLARLAEDREFLKETITNHPRDGDLDWEVISAYFGRWSKGGAAVKHQYYSVVRLMKEARREGRRGSNYVELVCKALSELPDHQGTILDLQKQLKFKYYKHLDKYKDKNGKIRWKKAVGEVLREEEGFFENVGKTETGKIIWRLKTQQEIV